MAVERLLSIAVAVTLVVGLGTAAATLGSSVETTPDDAITIDSATVPLGTGELIEYKERLQSDPSPASKNTGDAGDDAAEAPGGSETKTIAESGEGDGPDRAQAEGKGQGPGPGEDEQSLLERLLALLRAFLDLLASILPGLALVAILGAAVANRDRLAALLADLGHERGSSSTDGPGDGPPTRAAPGNDVERAWHEMVALAGVERFETTTPRQGAATAMDAGADPSAVERLTGTFEAVRYGGEPVTDERRTRVRDDLRQIRTQLGGGA